MARVRHNWSDLGQIQVVGLYIVSPGWGRKVLKQFASSGHPRTEPDPQAQWLQLHGHLKPTTNGMVIQVLLLLFKIWDDS